MKAVESWKPIMGFEGLYEVSDLGRIRSLVDNHRQRRERVLKLKTDKAGYLYINLYKKKNIKTYKVHRLVALAFVEGRDLFNNQVNHINEDKSDNRAINLEWCTAKDNCNHGTRNERMVNTLIKRQQCCIPIVQLTIDYKFIKKWPGARSVQREIGYNQQNVTKCCQHKYSKTGGYRWFYLNEYEELCFKIVTVQHPYHLALPYRA